MPPTRGTNVQATDLAEEYVNKKIVIPEFYNDGLHMAVSAVKEIEYLLSWNCKHIVNPVVRDAMMKVNDSFGYSTPKICTLVEFNEIFGE